MIIGDPSRIAIESRITYPYPRLSQRGLGSFVIYVGGVRFGRQSAEATLLACSFDAVAERLDNAGKHIASFLQDVGGAKIVDAVIASMYDVGRHDEKFFGISSEEFRNALNKSNIIWAPDGDRAFDDGSQILQFDCGDNVRLIGFRNCETADKVEQSISDISLSALEFYGVLSRWYNAFEIEWAEAIKFATRH